MARGHRADSLIAELREALLEIHGPDEPAERAWALRESARMSLDCLDRPEEALADAKASLELAVNCGIDVSPYRSIYCRSLFRTGRYDELSRFSAGYEHFCAEMKLWSGLAGFCIQGTFPVIRKEELVSLPKETLYEYAVFALSNGFPSEARIAAANANSFLFNERCGRVIAESYFDEGKFDRAGRIFRRMIIEGASDVNLFIRYADSAALSGSAETAVAFLMRHPPSDSLLLHLLLFNLASILGDTGTMKRSLVAMGLIARGVLYFLKGAHYFRKAGATAAARAFLHRALARVNGPAMNAPHERMIALSLMCEETLQKSDADAAASLLGRTGSLPVTERLIYECSLKELASRNGVDMSEDEPWDARRSRLWPMVILLMLLLLVFLIVLDTFMDL